MGAPFPGAGHVSAEPLALRAYAKLNLTLEVLNRRPDGYHEVRSVLQTIDLHDVITLDPAPALELRCDDAELSGEDNLALKAARLLQSQAPGAHGARITLRKRIPVAAGLGGGSTDAAATLVGLNRLWELGLTPGDLAVLAAQLGSDVPFFLSGGTALVQGRGEVVAPLPPLPPMRFIVVRPPIAIAAKTRTMYGALKPSMFNRGEVTEALVGALKRGDTLTKVDLFNVFDQVAPSVYPGFDQFQRRLETLGLGQVHLAGAGPAVFAPAASEAQGSALPSRLQAEGFEAYLVSTVPSQP
jgi:4-diphosphocytidyl-2-C-methyl-D-erythritol kinase